MSINYVTHTKTVQVMRHASDHHLTAKVSFSTAVFMDSFRRFQCTSCVCRAQLARMANLDASWAMSNGLTTQGNPAWLNLYLCACKLLDVALVLPSEIIPQFQLYRWAFTGDPGAEAEQPAPPPAGAADKKKRGNKEQPLQPVFVPHVFRISKLMNRMVCAGSYRAVSNAFKGQLNLATLVWLPFRAKVGSAA